MRMADGQFDPSTAPDKDVLDARDVAAGYGSRRIVSGIDLNLRGGDILGLMGGNGSGKSTLLKALTGQIPLKSGRVAIDGFDVGRQPRLAKARLGFAADAADLPAMLTGRQYLELVASLHGLPLEAATPAELVGRLQLDPWLDSVVEACSFGTRGKLSIVAALLPRPPLVILDESLNGLDPLAAFEIKSLIGDWARTGRHAFIVSTHVVEIVPTLCTTAVFLAGGRIVQRWTAEGLDGSRRHPRGFEGAIMAALRAGAEQGRAAAPRPCA